MVRVDPDAIAEVFARRGIMLDEMDIITEVWRITPMFYPGECCVWIDDDLSLVLLPWPR
jgi:hypothetical protein